MLFCEKKMGIWLGHVTALIDATIRCRMEKSSGVLWCRWSDPTLPTRSLFINFSFSQSKIQTRREGQAESETRKEASAVVLFLPLMLLLLLLLRLVVLFLVEGGGAGAGVFVVFLALGVAAAAAATAAAAFVDERRRHGTWLVVDFDWAPRRQITGYRRRKAPGEVCGAARMARPHSTIWKSASPLSDFQAKWFGTYNDHLACLIKTSKR